jgi:hypothetical protein
VNRLGGIEASARINLIDKMGEKMTIKYNAVITWKNGKRKTLEERNSPEEAFYSLANLSEKERKYLKYYMIKAK